jgi:hypothetical protein
MAASSTAWLKINASGTPVYWNKDYTTKNVTTNEDGDDTSAGKFYWQNRLSHVFLALADYNQLTTNTYNSGAQGALKMYPDGDNKDDKTLMVNGNTLANDSSINVYDLTRGDKTSMAEQPDPIVALTAQVPANYISNTVALTFKHQFAQVQVNVFNDRSADQSVSLTSELITKVELIDVSTEGYVYNRINEDGTVTLTREGSIGPEGRGYAVYNEDGEKLGNIASNDIYVINGKPYSEKSSSLYSFDANGGDIDFIETVKAKDEHRLGAARGIVTVDISAEQAGGEVVVSTPDGKVLATKRVGIGQTQVNDQPLPTGIYVVSLLKDGKVMESEKYLVQ